MRLPWSGLGWMMLGAFLTLARATATHANHWAFEPIAETLPPATVDPEWCRTPVDRFILARLEQSGLRPAIAADPRTLIRRITFDLTGLPPTPAEVEAFLDGGRRDPRGAVRSLVERLLASPHYGERWGRWWLDVARYADTNGQDENKVLGSAWRYRDWVIRSFNANRPFDRFITEQLAGDLLPPDPTRTGNFDGLIATGFLILGPKMLAEQDKPKLVMDIVDEQIDTVGRAFLGLTLGCARCHDHKFDPIPARDYYALAGIFKSTRTMENLDFVSKPNERPISTKEQLAAIDAHARRLTGQTNRITAFQREANEMLVSGFKRDFPIHLSAALQADGPASTDPGSNSVRFLRMLTDPDPATHLVSQVLREVAAKPGRAAGFLGELETAANTTNATGLGPGRIGAGFRATGKNHLELPHSPELDPSQLTVEAWVRTDSFPDSGDTRRWLVNKNGNEWTEGHYALLIDRNQAGAYLNIGGTKSDVFAVWSGTQTLGTNRWHHLAFTYDGADLRLFLDGKPAGETSVKRARIPGHLSLALGRRQDGYINFQGTLDEVHVFDRALTASELSARFEHPENPVADGVVARWEFNDLSDADRRRVTLGEVREALFGVGGPLALPKDPRTLYPPATLATLTALENERDTLLATAPPPPAFALAAAEEQPIELPIHVRGSHLNLAKDPVPRGFIAAVSRPGQSAGIPSDHSGRLEMAHWITDAGNPLTARVIVNRVWQAHFGEGLVRTPDNFGVRGESPSHPELLDWLAAGFIRSGWDMKALHRLILYSSVFLQSATSDDPSATVAADPENRLLSHFPRQRLDAEMIRDALLTVSGRLDPALGGSLVDWKDNEYVPGDEISARSVRRTVYLPIVRDRVYDALTLFDFANPSVCSARRTPTVVSHQALFFLNSPLVKDSAGVLAQSLLARADLDDAARIREAMTRVLNRPATPAEVRRALRFLDELPKGSATGADDRDRRRADLAAFCQTLFAANEFMYRH